ncbi:MAG: hypothetical protein RSC69_07800 [Lachnospiraceae bacterium]
MKSIIIGVTVVMTTVLGLGILCAMNGRSLREEELSQNLSRAMEQSIHSLLNKNNYTIANREALIADFLEQLLLSVTAEGDLTVRIIAADEKKGLLSVEVVEEFWHPNGKKGSISCRKTIILEEETKVQEEEEKKFCRILFYADDQLYKSYSIRAGSRLMWPIPPTKEGEVFSYWSQTNGEQIQMQALAVSEDLSFKAVFSH